MCVCAFTALKTHVRCKTNPGIFSCRVFLSCLSSVKKADKSKNVGERDGGTQLTAGRERRICLERGDEEKWREGGDEERKTARGRGLSLRRRRRSKRHGQTGEERMGKEKFREGGKK